MRNSKKKSVGAVILSAHIPVSAFGAVKLPHDSVVNVVVNPQTPLEKRMTGELCSYLEKVLGKAPRIAPELSKVQDNVPAIILSSQPLTAPVALSAPEGHPEAYALKTTEIDKRPVVLAVGNTDKGMKRAIQRLVIKSRQKKDALVIPDLALSEKPWIPEREWNIAPWAPRFPAIPEGFPLMNTNADLRMDIYQYNDEQLSKYADMFDWFGFSGVQLIEFEYNYAYFKSPEPYQNWERRLFRAARETGQNVSIVNWVGIMGVYGGWKDPDVVLVPEKGKTAFEDLKVRKTLEKYFDIYARMAPLLDRCIVGWCEGTLGTWDDQFQYTRLYEEKFRKQNPDIKMAECGWSTPLKYFDAMDQKGFANYTFLARNMPPDAVSSAERTKFHERIKKHGVNDVGIWGWYTTHMEPDQTCSMYVNAQLYRKICQEIKEGASQAYPISYWSEMEGYHLNDIYTMYAASQLLWNPERDPHEILYEICEGIWGPRKGGKVVDALELIQDVRSGPKVETYWWTCKEYRVGTADPKEDLRRAEESIAAFDGMLADPGFVPKFPMPFPPETFAELIVPHLKQIRAFSEFRVKMLRIREEAAKGTSKEKLTEMVLEAWQPIPFYNTWVGSFGLPESEAQTRIVRCLCNDLGLKIKDPAWYTTPPYSYHPSLTSTNLANSYRGGQNSNVK